MRKISRTASLLICLLGYLTALTTAAALFNILKPIEHPLLAVFLPDLAATLIIFCFSFAFNNTSFYDPYWSLAPLPIFWIWIRLSPLPGVNPIRPYILLALTGIWAGRLTYNWIRRWKGLHDEDWRYSVFRSFPKPIYWLISLFGLHLFPTLIVFAGCLSAYPALCLMNTPPGLFDGIALMVIFLAILIEATADRQLTRFLRNRRDTSFLSSGLWKYSRHPNYFGEVLFWTGLFLFSVPVLSSNWYILAGPLAMIGMFSFISVPMMDKRMKQRKPGYEAYMTGTGALIPRRKKGAEPLRGNGE